MRRRRMRRAASRTGYTPSRFRDVRFSSRRSSVSERVRLQEGRRRSPAPRDSQAMPKSIQQLFDLSSRVAIVTCGSRGLGLEIAEGLAEAGASLMLCARRAPWLTPAIDALRERGFRVEGRACAVSDPDQVQAVVTAAIETFGRIDILVNNAGISWGERPETMALDQWKRVLDTNLTGPFLFSHPPPPEMF